MPILMHDDSLEDTIREPSLDQLAKSLGIDQLHYFSEVDSTNNFALNWCRETTAGPPQTALVYTESQTCGRGRGAHQWWSAAGALTFTLVIPVAAEPEPFASATALGPWPLRTGLAVAEALERIHGSPAIQLKWPNDLMASGRKLGGILIERPDLKDPRMVVGIGLNVHNSMADAPVELSRSAIALCDHPTWNGSRWQTLEAVIRSVWNEFSLNRDGPAVQSPTSPPTGSWLQRWRGRCFLSGRRIRVADANRQYTGTCGGIDSQGRLWLEDESLGRQVLTSGTIEAWDEVG